MSLRVVAGLCWVLFVIPVRGSASTLTIQNASFENPICGSAAAYGYTCALSNWTFTTDGLGVGGGFLPDSSAWDSIPDGAQVSFSNGGTLTQTLVATFTPATVYTLSVFVSQRWSAGSFQPDIELLAGSTPLIEMTNANPGGAAPTQLKDGTYTWVDWTMSYTTPDSGAMIGLPLTISLGSTGIQTDFDNISLTTSTASNGEDPPVPEPGTITLLVGGFLALAARRRLRK